MPLVFSKSKEGTVHKPSLNKPMFVSMFFAKSTKCGRCRGAK